MKKRLAVASVPLWLVALAGFTGCATRRRKPRVHSINDWMFGFVNVV